MEENNLLLKLQENVYVTVCVWLPTGGKHNGYFCKYEIQNRMLYYHLLTWATGCSKTNIYNLVDLFQENNVEHIWNMGKVFFKLKKNKIIFIKNKKKTLKKKQENSENHVEIWWKFGGNFH